MIRLLRTATLVAGLAALTTTLPGEIPCCELRYEVRPDPTTGAVDVTLTVQGFRGDSLTLVRPSARPLVGLLSQDPVVEGVRRAQWSLEDGAPRWSYAQPPRGWGERIKIRYRLAITAEKPLNAWSVGMSRDLLYAPAEALFIVPSMPEQATLHAPVKVVWEAPKKWLTFTGWESDDFHGTRSLLKTNILAGDIQHRDVHACGISVDLAAHGEWKFSINEMATDIARIACAAQRRLGDPGVDRYAVTLVQARFPMTSGNRNGPHAIGFVHSLPDGAPPSTRLLAHELVHLWQQFDAPTWFQEGVNDYLALRLAHEAGLFEDKEYREHLDAIDIVYRGHPHRKRWTFADEEREAPPFGPSDTYLAYRKGAIVGLALDRELRLRSGGVVDLATLWREMNRRASWGQVEWSDGDIATRAAALLEGNLRNFFESYVHGTEDLERPQVLLAGLPPLREPRQENRGIGAVAAFLQATLSQIVQE